MGRDEYLMWKEFYRTGPWGEERADLRAGIIASTIANVNRGRGQKAFAAADFMPRYGVSTVRQAPGRQQTPADMLEIFREFTRSAGGTINGKVEN